MFRAAGRDAVGRVEPGRCGLGVLPKSTGERPPGKVRRHAGRFREGPSLPPPPGRVRPVRPKCQTMVMAQKSTRRCSEGGERPWSRSTWCGPPRVELGRVHAHISGVAEGRSAALELRHLFAMLRHMSEGDQADCTNMLSAKMLARRIWITQKARRRWSKLPNWMGFFDSVMASSSDDKWVAQSVAASFSRRTSGISRRSGAARLAARTAERKAPPEGNSRAVWVAPPSASRAVRGARPP